jgi:hypothetical protein
MNIQGQPQRAQRAHSRSCHPRFVFLTLFVLLAVGVVQSSSAFAQSVESDPVAELRQQLEVRDQAIRNLIRRIEQLERAVGGMQAQANGESEGAAMQPAAQTAATNAPAEANAAVEMDLNRLRTAFERTLIDRGGLVLPTGTLEIDAGMTYSHASSEALTIDGFTIFPVLVVGDIVSERVRRDTTTANLTARYGLPWGLQAELRVPYIHEETSRVSGDGEETRLSGSGLGDVELALSRQLWRAADGGFDLLGSLRWKTATGRDAFGGAATDIPFGSGFDALSASLTGVSVLDPVVFFGGVSYTKSLADEKGGVRIAPGDSIGLQFGTALALNLDTSINFAFGQQFTRRTEVGGYDVPGSYINTGTLSIGVSRVLMSGTSLDGSLIIGLSEDSPDLQLAFSMPFRGW